MDDTPKKHLFTRSNYLLDLDHLHALAQVAPGGKVQKFLSELCLIYLRDAPLVMQDIEKALAKRDKKAVIQHSHRLKGMSTSLGASYMSELSQKLETAMTENPRDFPLAQGLSEQLKDAHLVTRDQIQAYVGQLPTD